MVQKSFNTFSIVNFCLQFRALFLTSRRGSKNVDISAVSSESGRKKPQFCSFGALYPPNCRNTSISYSSEKGCGGPFAFSGVQKHEGGKEFAETPIFVVSFSAKKGLLLQCRCFFDILSRRESETSGRDLVPQNWPFFAGYGGILVLVTKMWAADRS